jgi:LacI family transcriptional regulator
MTEESGSPSGTESGRRAVTIYDVAKHAGVSSMTVSRVLNGQRYVSDATRARVQESIAALNFSPNLAASNLRSALKIGLLYSNPSSSNLGEFLMGAFQQSNESGCQLLIEPGFGHANPIVPIAKLIDLGVDGVILPPPLCDDAGVLNHLSGLDVPALGFATAQPKPGFSAVLIDDFAGASLMVKHLYDLGHRDIGFIRGDPLHSTAVRREQGFRDAMEKHGLEVREDRVAQGYFTYRSGLDAARILLNRPDPPSAIFASNDDMAAATSAVAHGRGLRIPADLSIAGFDDTSLATSVWPEMTTIRQPIGLMASSAVNIMADYIRQRRAGERAPIEHHLIDFTLIERASTAPPTKQD